MRQAEEEEKQHKRLVRELLDQLERFLHIPSIYVDDLPSAAPPVFDPFLEGTKLMAEYKWDDAIAEFQKAMKEAKGSQLVALFNLIAICYYTSGRLSLALENYEESLRFARQFNDKEGKAKALGNIGLILKARGDLNQALKYLEEALKTDKEIGFRKGEANQLGNIGLIYQAKGDLNRAVEYHEENLKVAREIGLQESEAAALGNIGLIYQAKGNLDQALKYYQDALEINKRIGRKEGEAIQLGNVGAIYQTKGDVDHALKYLNEALKIFEEIGMQREIDQTKRNIERISQQMKK